VFAGIKRKLIVLPIAAGLFLFTTLSFAIHDRIKRAGGDRYRQHKQELAFDPKSGSLNLILYRVIFNRQYAGNPTEEEIREFLAMVLCEIKGRSKNFS
jgi:hypothetical protein